MNELRLSAWLNGIAAKYGDRPAITCGQTVTYSQLKTYTLRFAQRLIRMGVKKGDRVVLWAVNGIDWMVGFLGTVMVGGVAVLMNYGLNSEDVAQLEKLVGASWMIVGGNKVSAADPNAAAKAALDGGIPRSIFSR